MYLSNEYPKFSSILTVVNYYSDHPQISAKHSYWYCAL